MASSAIYSIEIGARSGGTPGDIDASTGLPDVSSVTFLALACDGSQALTSIGGGAERFSDVAYGRRDAGETTPVATALVNLSGSAVFGAASGAPITVYLPDAFTLQHRWRCYGATDPGTLADGIMLESIMAVRVPSAATFSASGIGGDVFTIPVADASAVPFVVGDVIVANGGGNFATYHEVVDIDTDNDEVAIWPGLAAVTAADDDFTCCRTYYPDIGAATDFHVRYAAGDTGAAASVGRLAPMCVLSGLTLGKRDDGGIDATWTVSPKVALINDAAAVTVATAEREAPLMLADVGTTITLSDDISAASAPYATAADIAALERYDWTIDIQAAIGDGAHNGKTVAMTSDREVTNVTAAITLNTVESTDVKSAFQAMLTTEAQRRVVFNIGPNFVPGGAGGLGTPRGAGFIASVARADGSFALTAGDQERLRRSVVLRAVTDAPTLADADTPLARAAFKLAIPMGA